jgi:hypothetical protein
MNKDFSKLCTPAKVYFAIAVISSIFALFHRFSVASVAVKLFFAFIWTFVLGWLCDKGYKSLSWFLVLLPYIVILLSLLGLIHMGNNSMAMMIREGLTSGPDSNKKNNPHQDYDDSKTSK